MNSYSVYIVECQDSTYYTGVTNDLERRLWEHNFGDEEKAYTYRRRPVKLKFAEHFHDITQAIEFEKQIKRWSRKKKEALFERNWKKIIDLSKSASADGSTGSP